MGVAEYTLFEKITTPPTTRVHDPTDTPLAAPNSYEIFCSTDGTSGLFVALMSESDGDLVPEIVLPEESV